MRAKGSAPRLGKVRYQAYRPPYCAVPTGTEYGVPTYLLASVPHLLRTVNVEARSAETRGAARLGEGRGQVEEAAPAGACLVGF